MWRMFLGAVALLLLTVRAEARCMAGSIGLMPAGGALPANGRIVLTGAGRSAAWVAKLEEAWLIAGAERIRVRAGEHLHGASEQVMLTPDKPLKPGQKVRLAVSQASTDDRYTLEHTTWKVRAADEAPPSWEHPPTILGMERERLGCGDAELVRVHTAVADDTGGAQLLVRASIEGAGTTETFWLPVRDGVVTLGHGMCGGGWVPREGESYTATLTATDAAGNVAVPTQPLAFMVRFDGQDVGALEPDAGASDAGAGAPVVTVETGAPPAASCTTSPRGKVTSGGALLVGLATLLAIRRRRVALS